MTEQAKEDSLVPKRISASPLQLTRMEQIIVGMPYRLHTPTGLVQFVVMLVGKTISVQITKVVGTADVGGQAELNFQYLGLAPMKTSDQEMWFPHWLEAAVDVLKPHEYSQQSPQYQSIAAFVQSFNGGVAEILGDSYSQADVKQISVTNRKAVVENSRMWVPEFGSAKWYSVPGQPQEIVFSEMLLYPDWRIAARTDVGWIVFHQKR